MSEEISPKQMQAILEATPWRCFHCDFITNDHAEAESHFGERDDAGEFTPTCKWWASMDDTERKQEFQTLIQELNGERDTNADLLRENEKLEYIAGSHDSEIKSHKPFRECRSIRDIFNLYDSMEGRALASEEREQHLVSLINDEGYTVMIEDSGRWFLRKELRLPPQPPARMEI